jgi:hypothetical protein
MAKVIQYQPLKLKLLLLAFLLVSGFFQGFTAHELNAQNPSQTIHIIEIEGTSDLEKSTDTLHDPKSGWRSTRSEKTSAGHSHFYMT